MAFEVFIPKTKVIYNKYYIKLSKKTIFISKLVKQKFINNKIQLAYDVDTKTIRLKVIKEGENGLLVEHQKINAETFFSHFNIKIQGSFNAEWNEKDKAFYIKLEE